MYNNYSRREANYTIETVLRFLGSVIVSICFIIVLTIAETVVFRELQ